MQCVFILACVLAACAAVDLPPNTVVTGDGPIQRIPVSFTKPLEEKFTKALFTSKCGSADIRPLCNCASGDQWNHPYFIANCADGQGPTDCTCPNGTPVPV